LQHPWYRSAYSGIRKDARGRLLEIGCGRGEFAIFLAKTLPQIEITAVDFSSSAIAQAQQWAAKENVKVDFREGDAQAINLPSASFDYVVSCECIEHVENPAKVLDEVYRLLKADGRFCITTENYFNGMVLAWLHAWVTGRPYNSGSGVQPRENFFVFWHVLKLLRTSGLHVERTESCHYQWLLLPRVAPAKLSTEEIASPLLRGLAKPFGRHFSYFGTKPC
jgi:2-polyprenyl-3-methyl-5-hydroxy-6-metoxy-1,4-benzoquinol methylase